MSRVLRDARSACLDHQCPACGTHDRVTVEQVVTGDRVLTQCLCRACGHVWHPQVDRLDPPGE